MRRTIRLLLATLLGAVPAMAQTPAPAVPPVPESSLAADGGGGEVTAGVRINSTGDVGRFFPYVDLRTGPTLERLAYTRSKRDWQFDLHAFNAGYRDQRYTAAFERFGKLRAGFDYNQVPLWFGNVEQTPYREENPGVFRLNDTIQAAVQAGTATVNAYQGDLRPLDLRLRRDIATGTFNYAATKALDLSLVFANTKRTGQQPWSAPFGFSNTDVVPLPIDRRTNELTAAAEWDTTHGHARLAYDGSFFDNGIETLVWDNPLRFTDTNNSSGYSTGAVSSQGRMSLAPDSTAHTVSGSWAMALPRRSRLVAFASVGTWLQNDTLLPFTINSSVTPIPLPRDTAEAKAVITSTNLRYTSRPTANTWVSANYRLYDFDNRSEPFPLTTIVRLDGTVAASPEPETEPFGYQRHFGDVDFSYTKFRNVALRAGYNVEHDNRTYRYVERTTDHQVRVSADSTGLAWGSVRLQYDHSIRVGSGLDEQVLEDLGEQESLRQFDIANRDRDRVSLILQYLPTSALGLSGSASLGRERRPESAFGLQDNDVKAVTVGIDYTPASFATFGLDYSFETYDTLQRSRQANPPPDPTFTDPRRDWTLDMGEHVNTFGVRLEFPRIAKHTSLRIAYDDVHDSARYVYGLAPDSTLPPVSQLPDILNHFSFGTADVRYAWSKQVSFGAGYRMDNFDTNDFALTPGTLNSPFIPTYFNLQYQWRPYTVHTGFVRLIYSF